MILASAIRQVRGHGDNKFEVVTSLRTFIFRAEREGTSLSGSSHSSCSPAGPNFSAGLVFPSSSSSLIPVCRPPRVCLPLISLVLALLSLNGSAVILCLTSSCPALLTSGFNLVLAGI